MTRTVAVLALVALVYASAERAAGQRRFGPGVCGPVDPSYIRTSTETGGQPFFLSPGEIAESAHIMSASMGGELMLWASADRERTYSIPIDATVERAAFSASFDSKGGSLTVTTPDGSTVQQSPQTQDTTMNCGRVVTIEAPATGVWRVQVTPTGRFWLAAHARSELSLMTAQFVERRGRPGHEGLFRIHGQPIAGRRATLRAVLSSDVRTATFGLFSVGGLPLQTLDMPSVDGDEFIGTFDLPTEPFRVAVTGVTDANAPYQRFYAGLFRAEQIEVIPPAVPVRVQIGSVTAVTFTVRNHGPAVRLTLVAVDRRGTIVAVQPSTLQLDPHTEGSAVVRLPVPNDLTPETRVGVTLTAAGDGPSLRANSASVEFSVGQ